MAARVGIELAPTAIRIVEVDDARSRPDSAGEARVRSYAVLPPGGQEMSAGLAALRGRDAAVAVWGVSGAQHSVVVPEGRYDKMRADTLRSAREAGIVTDGMLADISPSGSLQTESGSRAVILTLAPADEIAAAVRPIEDAGLRVRSVTTPAGALMSLARARRALAAPQPVEAYVALEDLATAVALLRNGALVAARELPWGYLEGAPARPQVRSREDIASRLVDELTRLFSAVGIVPASVGQVAICGALPELRSMTVSMMERLDVEVEPLDSLFGIDSAQLPESPDDFRERIAALRLAWAAAVDWPPPINLLRYRQGRRMTTALARAAVVAGVGVGLGAGWLIERSSWWQGTANAARVESSRSVARAAPPPLAPPRAPAAATGANTPVARATTPQTMSPPAAAGAGAPSTPPGSVVRPAPSAPASVTTTAPPQAPVVRPTPPPPATTAKAAPPSAPVVTPAPAAVTKAAPPPAVVVRPAPSAPIAAVRTAPTVPEVRPAPPAPAAVARAAPPPAAVAKPAPSAPAAVTRAASPPAPVAAASPAPASTAARAVSPPAVGRPAAPADTRAASPPPAVPRPVLPAPAAVIRSTPQPAPAPVVTAPPARPPVATAAVPPPLAPRTSAPPARVTPASPAQMPSPSTSTKPADSPVTAPRPAIAVAPPAVRRPESPEPSPPRATPPSRVAEPAPTAPPQAPTRMSERQGEPSTPFDAALSTILYSADRKLAIIDGRIVGLGDVVKGARVIEITASTVILRDAQGRLRTLALASAAP